MLVKKLDEKFDGVIFKVKDGSIVPPDRYMVFLVQDLAFLPTLNFYLSKCLELKCDDDHIRAIHRTIARARDWQSENIDLIKKPDAKGERLLDLG